MELHAKQILITGALGWLGRNLVDAVKRGLPDCGLLPQPGVTVRCLVLPGQDAAPLAALSNDVDVVEGDIQQLDDCRRFCQASADAVLLHTAGVIHPHRVADFYRVNVTGTKNLLDACADAGVRRAVVVSSNSPCGCNPHPDHLFDEDSAYEPYMNYGRSKMQMEQIVKACHDEGQLETVIIRAPWFYGPQQPQRQTLFFKMIRDGKMPIVGSGENRRSMAYVDNLCQGILRAAAAPHASGKTYWIADEQPYTMNEIVDTVETLLESQFGQTCAHRRLRLPGFVGRVAFALDATWQRLGMYHQKIHVLSEMNQTIACSVSRAKHELGYAPAVALEEGMSRSMKWCFAQGYLP